LLVQISKDDLSQYQETNVSPSEAHDLDRAALDLHLKPPVLAWPDVVVKNQASITAFMRACHEMSMQILDVLTIQAGLPPLARRNLHAFENPSGDVLRVIRGPPRRTHADDKDIHTPLHRDFGTVTILFNWLGGLQVADSKGEMTWVRPKAAHAIVIAGSALGHFLDGEAVGSSFGALHRVVSAPGEQGEYARYSLGYFTRPEDDVLLEQVTRW
jgi:isopenicillin N synthase-like dioxygenase